jgi:hypothetical protein
MCNICYAQENNIPMIATRPTLGMCDEHYREWVQEKIYND